MSIRKKIWSLVAIALGICSVLVLIGVFGLKRVDSGVSQITQGVIPAMEAASDVRVLYLSMYAAAYDQATNSDATKVAAMDQKVRSIYDETIKRITDYANLTTDAEELKVLDETRTAMGTFMDRMNQVKALANMGETKMATDVMQSKVQELHTAIGGSLEKLSTLRKQQASAVSEQSGKVFRATMAFSIGAALAGLVALAAIGFVLARSITGPLGTMQQAITRTSNNLDFTQPVAVTSKDEVGLTLQAYNGLLEKLRRSFAEIQRAASQMTQAVDEVDSSSRQIAENSRQQSDATTGMASAIEELTVSISVIADRARDASQHTQDSQNNADRGTSVIMETVAGIQSISDSVRSASERIVALRDDSESISSVANMIKEIADQTNLLALNAAIEAARAGEQGRGFAVVADEVRKLAERTTHATVEISTLIQKMQDGARDAVESMTSSVGEVGRGVENAQRAGEAIREIQNGSGMVVSVVDEMTDAMREQTVASTTIARQIEQIAQMTERNSAAASSSAESVDRLSRVGHEIARAVSAYRV